MTFKTKNQLTMLRQNAEAQLAHMFRTGEEHRQILGASQEDLNRAIDRLKAEVERYRKLEEARR